MKQKHATMPLIGLGKQDGSISGPHRKDPASGRYEYRMNQPGYYLIRLRLKHSQKALQPLAKIP